MKNENSKYAASADSVGDWGGREQKISDRWNDEILPILAARENALNPESDSYESDLETLEYANSQAWESFCGSGGKIIEAKKLAAGSVRKVHAESGGEIIKENKIWKVEFWKTDEEGNGDIKVYQDNSGDVIPQGTFAQAVLTANRAGVCVDVYEVGAKG